MERFDFASLKDTVDTLHAQSVAVQKEIEMLRRERDELAVATPSKEDVIELLHRRIDSAAAEYPSDLTRTLGAFLRADKTSRIGEPAFSLAALLPLAAGAGTGMSAATWMHSAAFIFRDHLKKAVADAINAAEWPEQTVRLAHREKRLAELDDQIGKLDEADKKLREHAARAGVVLR